jgi:hypothetical protein
MKAKTSLLVFEHGARLLAEANTIQKTRELKALALTAAEWARQKKLGDQAVLSARGYALAAERKMGQMLKESAEKGERASVGKPAKANSSPAELLAPTLADIGVTRKESYNAQQLADLPSEVFDELKSGRLPRAQAVARRNGQILKQSRGIRQLDSKQRKQQAQEFRWKILKLVQLHVVSNLGSRAKTGRWLVELAWGILFQGLKLLSRDGGCGTRMSPEAHAEMVKFGKELIVRGEYLVADEEEGTNDKICHVR